MMKLKIIKIEKNRILLELPIVTDKNKIPKGSKYLCNCIIEI